MLNPAPRLVLVATLLVASSVTAAPPRVVIISVDGLRPDAIERAHATNLATLAREGASTMAARTIDPSVTLPAHASMLTGVRMSIHKVTWNQDDADEKSPAVPTVLQIATRAGLRAAMIAGKSKFHHLAAPGSGYYEFPGSTAALVFGAATPYLLREKPDLAVIHLADADLTGHRAGWMSAEYLQAVLDVDRELGGFLLTMKKAGMTAGLTILLTADHGGEGNNHHAPLDVNRRIPWIAWGAGIRVGVTLSRAISVMDTAPTALVCLGLPVPAYFQGRAVLEALASTPRARDAIPATAAGEDR